MVTITERVLRIISMLDEVAVDYKEAFPLDEKKHIISYLLDGAYAEGHCLYDYPAEVGSSLIKDLSETDWGGDCRFANGAIWVTTPTKPDYPKRGRLQQNIARFSSSLGEALPAEFYNQVLTTENTIRCYAGGTDGSVNIVDDVLTPEEGTLRGSNE